MIVERPLEGQPQPSLPPRQREVLALLADGLMDNEIAAVLGIAPRSVGNLVWKLYRRLGARNRAHAAAIGVRLGLVDEPPAGRS